MSVDLTSLTKLLDGIPDQTRVRRLIKRWEIEAQDQQTICFFERKWIELQKRLDELAARRSINAEGQAEDQLLNSKAAHKYVHMGPTKFTEYKNANMIQVANQVGNKHFFSQKHLDTFLAIPAHERNMRLAMAQAEALAEAETDTPSREPRWRKKKLKGKHQAIEQEK